MTNEEEEELTDLAWQLYELVYGYLGVDVKALIDNANEFHPVEVVASPEKVQLALNAMGNVIGAISFRDESLKTWFKENMNRTWKVQAEIAKQRQQ